MPLIVIIKDNDDGTYEVSSSDSDQSADESAGAGNDQAADQGAGVGAGEESGSPEGQTVDSIGEALRVARGLLTNDSQVEAANKGAPADDNAPMSGDQSKEAWNAEATKRAQAKQLFNQ